MSRILVYSPNHIGDVCMAMGPVIEKISQHDDLKILCNRVVAEIWRLNSITSDRLIVLEGKHSNPFSKQVAAIRKKRFSEAYLLSPSFRAGWIARSVGAKRIIGENGDYRKALLTQAVNMKEYKKSGAHRLKEYCHILDVSKKNFQVEMDLIPKDYPHIGLNDQQQKNILGIFPGSARGPSKQWPQEHFAELIKILNSREGLVPIVFGGKDDEELGEAIIKSAGTDGVNMCGKTTIAQLASLLKKTSVTVGNDSGGVHLASIVGAPVVSIFGLTDPQKTRPVGDMVSIVEADGEKNEAIQQNSRASTAALASISPKLVAEKTRRLLKGECQQFDI